MKVLFVDDDETMLEIGSYILPQLLPEVEITPASSGEEALALTETITFDVVVTDIYMPGISGLDLMREVRSRSTHTEFVIITGSPSLNSILEALRMGARDYTAKPLSFPIVAEKLRKIGEYQARVTQVENARLARSREATRLGGKVHELEGNLLAMEKAIGNATARLAEASLPLSRQELLALLDELIVFTFVGGGT